MLLSNTTASRQLLPMKTHPFLLTLGVVAVAGGFLFLANRPLQDPASPTPAGAIVTSAPESAGRASVPAPRPIGSDPAGAADLAADQRLLRQVIPSLDRPVTDWRQFRPATLTVVPVPGLPLEFTATSITTDGARTTWIGTNPEQGATLVACATETLWDGIVTVPGADEYSIHITPDSIRVIETAHGMNACGPVKPSPTLLRLAATEAAATIGTAEAAAAATTTYTSDVVVLYTAGAKNYWGGTAEIVNRINAVFTTMNVYLSQSEVDNLRWNLAGTAEVPAYPTTKVLEDDLERLADSRTELGAFAVQQRAAVGADQVLLIVDGERDYAGIAYVPGYLAVVHQPGSAATAAHELAHNFGCRHDRQEAEAADNDGRYYYGHRYTANGQDTGTIMSYASYIVPYFSNPSITYQGYAVGIAAGQPKAADNARWLREHADDIAALVPSKAVTTPQVTTQPASVTVASGRSFSLRVVATGNQLSYQWARDGVDLAGATAATYSRSLATAADAGSYSVLVSNSAGSVRSDTATVTVTAATTPTPTTPSTPGGSGGGGGGGAFSLGAALGLLALLAAGRRRGARGT